MSSNIYNLYEIFNDFNFLRILIAIYDRECTIEDISNRINLNSISIIHQLEFLIERKVVSKLEVDNTIKYKISNRKFNKIVNQIVNYTK